MVVFSKQITLLIHIIIHTNGTIKKNTSRIIHWKKKKIPALYGAEKKILSLKTCKKNIPAWPKKPTPPPLEVKWSLPNKKTKQSHEIDESRARRLIGQPQ